MATTNKKVSVNHINDYLKKEQNNNLSTLQLQDSTGKVIDTVEIKRQIDWSSVNQIIYNVTQGCFGTYGEIENCYIASKKEFLFRLYVLAYYTNLRITTNDNDRYKLAFSKLYDGIVLYIDSDQLSYLRNSIDMQIEYEKQTRIKHYEEDFNNTIVRFNNVVDNLEKFSEIDTNQIAAMVTKINNADIKELLTSLDDNKDNSE